MNHGRCLLTTYETWDDPPSNGYGALVKSELSNKMFFFPKAEQKFEEAVEKAKDAQAMFAEYLGRQKKGLGKVMTHMLHIHLAEIYGTCISKYSSPIRRIWLMIIW